MTGRDVLLGTSVTSSGTRVTRLCVAVTRVPTASLSRVTHPSRTTPQIGPLR